MDLDVKDHDQVCFCIYRTALHIAVSKNCVAAVKALVDAGASKKLRDASGLTPRMLATRLSHPELMEFLMSESEKQAIREGFCWRGRRRYYYRPGEERRHPF